MAELLCNIFVREQDLAMPQNYSSKAVIEKSP